MDLDPNTHRDLARFVARRYPKPEQRRDFAERARVHCPEPPQTRAEVAWGVLLSRAVEQRRIRQLLDAILRDSSADSQLQEVCTLVLGRPWPPPPPLLGPTRARWLGGVLALAGGSIGAWLVVHNLDPEPDPPSVYEAALQVQEAALGPSAAAHAHLPPAAGTPSALTQASELPTPAPMTETPAADSAKADAARAETEKAEAAKVVAAKAEAAKVEAAKAEAAKAEAAKAEAAKAEAAKAEAAKVEAAKAEAAKVAAAKAEAAKAEVAKAEAAKVAAARAEAAKAEAAKVEAAKVAAAKAETQAKAVAAASAQTRPTAVSPSQAALITQPSSPSGSRGGRCTSPQGGLIGWWYAGDTPPGKQGEIVVMDRSAYVRTDLPTAANGYKVGSASPCSVVRGDRLRLTGAPVQIPGGKWWVPIHSGDIQK